MRPDKNLCPKNIVHTIDRYVNNGLQPGGFVTAVLTNDLTSAVMLADSNNLENLPHIVAYIYDSVPSNCWGSKDRVRAWVEKKHEV